MPWNSPVDPWSEYNDPWKVPCCRVLKCPERSTRSASSPAASLDLCSNSDCDSRYSSIARAIVEADVAPSTKKSMMWTFMRSLSPAIEPKTSSSHTIMETQTESEAKHLDTQGAQTDFVENFFIGDDLVTHGESNDACTQSEIVLDVHDILAALQDPCELVEAATTNSFANITNHIYASTAHIETELAKVKEAVDLFAVDDFSSVLCPHRDFDNFLHSLPVLPESAQDVISAIERESLHAALCNFRCAVIEFSDSGHDVYESSIETSDLMPMVGDTGNFTDASLEEFFKVMIHLEQGPTYIHDRLLFPFEYELAIT